MPRDTELCEAGFRTGRRTVPVLFAIMTDDGVRGTWRLESIRARDEGAYTQVGELGTGASDWVELSSGRDTDKVKAAAAQRLSELGIDMSGLPDDQVRMDIVRTADGSGFVRVAVLKATIEAARARVAGPVDPAACRWAVTEPRQQARPSGPVRGT
jgi:hypothetical protein